MTETDATTRPLEMPAKFLPYLDKYRIYKVFKDMIRDLVINLPKDHLKHMKIYLTKYLHCTKDADRVVLLISPDLQIDTKALVKSLIKDLGVIVITRRCVIDRYEKHDNYEPGCITPELMSEITKKMALKDPVPQAGWLMFDHPCTLREARCLQQDGVLPSVTLVLVPPPSQATPTPNPHTPFRTFFQQDFEGLKFAYKATLKEVYVEADDEVDKIGRKCVSGIQACAAGLQGAGRGQHAGGAPGTYRVLLLGPHGAGCNTQARLLATHFTLVYLNFDDLYSEAKQRKDELSEKLCKFGTSVQLRAEIIRRRLVQKDCIENGWVLIGYPTSGIDFENLDLMATPPNRVVFLNADWDECKKRIMARGVDWCTGQRSPIGSGPRVKPYTDRSPSQLDSELDYYFTEALAELRAAAGITAVEVNAEDTIDNVQVKIQAAVMAAPIFDIESAQQLKNVRGE